MKIIDSLDLSSVAKAVAKNKLLPKSKLSVGEELYRVFLFLKKKYPTQTVIPHPMADVFWHQHILQTRKYHSDCNKVFGKYMHHEPASSTNLPRLKRAQKKTIDLLKKHFLS